MANNATLNNSQVLFYIGARGKSVYRASVRPQKADSLRVFGFDDVDGGAETLALAMLAKTIEDVTKHPTSAFITAPDSALYRVFEARKIINQDPDAPVEDVLDGLVKPWMMKEGNEAIKEATQDMGAAVYEWLHSDANVAIGFQPSHMTRSFELDADACDSAEIVNGQKLVFEKGVNQDFGITSRDNSMLDGEYEVHVSTFTTRNGQKSRYFVDRYDMENPSDSPRDRRLEILNKVLVPAVEEKLPHDLKATAFKVAAGGEEDAF